MSLLRTLLPELQLLDLWRRPRPVPPAPAPVAAPAPAATMPRAFGTASGTMVPSLIHATAAGPRPKPVAAADRPAFATSEQAARYVQGLAGTFPKQCGCHPKPAETLAKMAARWALGGIKKGRPTGTVLLAGTRSSGKSFVARAFAAILTAGKVIPEVPYEEIDLAGFAGEDARARLFHRILVPEVSGGVRRVFAFDNVDAAAPGVLDMIAELVSTGETRCDDQELSLDGCFVILMSSLGMSPFQPHAKLPTALADRLGRVLRGLDEVVIFDPPSNALVAEVLRERADAMNRDLLSVARLGVELAESAEDWIVEQARKSGAFSGELDVLLEKFVRIPLVDLKFAGKIVEGTVRVQHKQRLIARQGGVEHVLAASGPQFAERADPLAALNKLVGLGSVKERVAEIIAAARHQQDLREHGIEAAGQTLNMVFTGNPGTGKTTVARLVGRALREAGILRTGELVEVTRADLVAGYVGQTATRTAEVVRRALGGVLFIDEAYALTGTGGADNADFGKEAIDQLVKMIEDHRGDLVVIVAGYTREMEQFLEANPGLTSRFPFIVEFPDYTPQEMLSIFEITAAAQGYTLADGAKEAALDVFTRRQVPGRDDGGNGRLVRNVFEGAVRQLGKRLSAGKAASIEEKTAILPADFRDYAVTEADFDLTAELAGVVGLEPVKAQLRKLAAQVDAERRRREHGIAAAGTQSLNMMFIGNPGTGKTTVAHKVARMLKAMGVLKTGQLIEADRTTLVSPYVGRTAERTRKEIERALGGILFIDEAYALSRNGDPAGQEAIDTLVKEMEEHRENLVVVLAGYRQEMEEFLDANSGLKSRFRLVFEFPDYGAAELAEITRRMVAAQGYALADGLSDDLPELFERTVVKGQAASGNGRLARNMLDAAKENLNLRLQAVKDPSAAELVTLTAADFGLTDAPPDEGGAMRRLTDLVGLDAVKSEISALRDFLVVNRQRRERGLPVLPQPPLHMAFSGNPGTGKTTVARLLGELLKELGMLKSGQLVEVQRADLVAGYMGQTAEKTRKVVERALGGVLFIDEAYALVRDERDTFGTEALDTLMKLMEDNRDDLVVILAGYEEELQGLMGANPGIRSRVSRWITFADYTEAELTRICLQLLARQHLTPTDGALRRLEEACRHLPQEEGFANGRSARNFIDTVIARQNSRLAAHPPTNEADYQTIVESDVP